MAKLLPHRIRRADNPSFDNMARNVPAMVPSIPATLVRPTTTRYYGAPDDGGWQVLGLHADGTVTICATGSLSTMADRAASMQRHPSGHGTTYVVVLAPERAPATR